MKRILVFGLAHAYGGIENVVISFINRMTANDNLHFSILLNNRRDCMWKDKISNQNVDYLTINAWGKNPMRFDRELMRIIIESHFDCIWINVASLTTLMFLPSLRKFKNLRVLLHAHGAGIERQNFFKGLISRGIHEFVKYFLINKTDTLIACSQEAGRWMYGNRKFKIIWNGIDVEKFKFNPKTRSEYRHKMKLNNNTVYLSIGRLTMVKNQIFIIDVFRQIVKHAPKSILLIVGEGELMNELRDKVNRYNLCCEVRFLGFRTDVNNLLNAADIFLLPSLHEGFPLVSIEAQCSGIQSFVSETVPDEAIATQMVVKIPLSKQADYWAARILKEDTYERTDFSKQLSDHNLDIDSMCSSILNELVQTK